MSQQQFVAVIENETSANGKMIEICVYGNHSRANQYRPGMYVISRVCGKNTTI